MNKFWNWTQNASGERELRLEGMITDDDFAAEFFGADATTPKQFREELNSGGGDITVWINSEGGDCFAAASIFNMLKEYRGHVTIKIDSLAASAASVVAMAGDTVEISPVGMIMIHNPWTLAQGDSEELRASADFLDAIKETIINAYELKTHLPRERLAQMMDEETWLHAKPAVELRFADKVMFTSPTEKISAGMSSRRQVMNCMTQAMRAAQIKKTPDKNAAPFYKRLNFLRRQTHGDSRAFTETRKPF